MRRDYLDYLSNKNSINTFNTLANKMEEFENEIMKDFLNFTIEDLIIFFKKYYDNKTSATVCNSITMLRKIYKHYEKDVNAITLKLLKSHGIITKEQNYFSPSEIKEIIDSLVNAQDKALVILTYLGYYDKNFETIRNIKKEDLFFDELTIRNETIRVTSYIEEILLDASIEEYNYKENGDTYDLNDTPYIFRGRVSKNKEALSSVTLKKRLKSISNILDIENFTAVTIKNSRTLYDLALLEYESNITLKRHEIRNFCVKHDIVGSIELLERKLKENRSKIYEDIEKEKDLFF